MKDLILYGLGFGLPLLGIVALGFGWLLVIGVRYAEKNR